MASPGLVVAVVLDRPENFVFGSGHTQVPLGRHLLPGKLVGGVFRPMYACRGLPSGGFPGFLLKHAWFIFTQETLAGFAGPLGPL